MRRIHLLLAMLAAACAHTSSVRPVTPAQNPALLAARVALGPLRPAHERGGDPIDRSLRIAELARELGDAESSSEAMRMAYQRALAHDAYARAFEGAQAQQQARQRLAVVTGRCGELARKLAQPELAFACARGPVSLADDVLRWAIVAHDWASGFDDGTFASRFAGDPEVQFHLDEELSARALRKLGRAGLEALSTRIANGGAVGRARVIEAAHELVDSDPHHLRARVWTHLDEDEQAGRLVMTRELAQDLLAFAPMFSSGSSSIRVERASRAAPKAVSLALWLAAYYLEAELFGDALVLARKLEKLPTLGSAQKQTVELVAALAQAQVGDIAPLDVYIERHGAKRSGYVLSQVATLSAISALQKRASQAKVELLERDLPRYGYLDMEALAADPAVPAEARALAVEAALPGFRPLLSRCVTRKRSREACQQRLQAAQTLDEYEGSWQEVVALDPEEVQPEWLGQVLYLEDDLAQARVWLERARLTWLAQTRAFSQLDLVLATRHPDAAALARAVQKHAAQLGPSQQIAVALALLDRAQGRAPDLAGSLSTSSGPSEFASPRDPADPLPDWLEAEPSDASWVSAYQLGARFAGLGFVQRALALWQPLLPLLDGDAGTWLAYHTAELARVASDEGALTGALARLDALSPGSSLSGLARDRNAGSAQRCAGLLRQGLSSDSLATCVAAGRGAPARTRIWLELAHDVVPEPLLMALHRSRVSLSDAELVGLLRDPSGAALLDLDAGRLGRLLEHKGVADALWTPLRERVRDATPASAKALAVRLLPAFDRVPQERVYAAWLHWLAGNGKVAQSRALEAEAAGAEPHRMLRVPRVRERLSDERAARLFADASTSGLRIHDKELAAELAQLSPPELALDELACPALEGELASKVCARAYAAESTDPKVVARYAELLADPAASARGLDHMVFVTGAKLRLGRDTPGEVYHLESVHLAGLDRTEAAAKAELEAWARGYTADSREQDLVQARFRPMTFRWAARAGAWGNARQVALLFSTLGDGNIDAGLTYVKAVFARGFDGIEAEQQAYVYSTRDLLELGRRDRANGALDAVGFAEAIAASRGEGSYAAMGEVARRYPKSDLVKLMFAEELTPRGELDGAIASFRGLLERHPDIVASAIDLVGVLSLTRKFDEARALVAEARQRAPHDPRIASVTVPEGSGEVETPLAPVLATGAALSTALAQVSDEQLSGLEPTLATHEDSGAEVALPGQFGAHPNFDLGGQDDAFSVGVTSMPRASRCAAVQCLEPVLAQFARMGLHTTWKEPTELPVGEAAWSLVRGPGTALVTVVIASGERVYTIFAGGPEQSVVSHLPALRLALQTFRPLDAVLSSKMAQALRWETRASYQLEESVSDRVRLAARHATVKASGPCPFKKLLQELDSDASRGWLLLDVYLSTVDAAGRRAIASCATTPAEKQELGLVTLWDDDPALHDLGASIVRAEPSAAVAQFGLVAQSLEQRALASTQEKQEELPRHGLVELLSALPAAARETLARELAQSDSAAKRAAALVALSLADEGTLDAGRLSRIGTAGGGELYLLLRAGRRDVRVRDAARARLDALELKKPGEEMGLARVLADALVRWVDGADGERLERVRKLAAPYEGTSPLDDHSSLAWLARVHAVALGTATLAADDPQRDALSTFAATLRAARTPRVSQTRAREIAARPLSESLPGAGWSYFRVARPDLLLAGFDDLYRRLGADENPQRALAVSWLRAWFTRSGSQLLENGAGLDLARPIECAAPAYRPEAFVCSGYVRDAQVLRRELSQRQTGEDSGIALAMHAGRAATSLPLAAPLLPGLLHTLIYEQRSSTERARPIVARERIRMRSQIAGTDVLRTALMDVHDDATASLDTEIYLFQGPRWLVFATDDLAQWVLGAEPGERLSRDPGFRKATRGWRDGGALQAYVPDALDNRTASLELTTNARGIYARMRSEAPAQVHDVRRLVQALPEGAATKLGITDAASWLASAPELLAKAEAGPVPPLGLLKRARALSFGWYPAPGDPLWSRWLVVAELDEQASSEVLAQLPRDKPSRWKGLHVARRDPCIVVSSDPQLLEKGLERFDRAPSSHGRDVIGSGQVDGALSSAFLGQLGGKGNSLDTQSMVMRGLSALVNVARDLRFELSVRGGVQTLEAQLLPELSATGSETRLVDALGSGRERNALAFSGEVPPAWLERGLVVRLETAGPQAALLQAFPTSARLNASAADEHGVELRVLSADAQQPASRLTGGELTKRLRAESEIRPDHERVRVLARSITQGIPETDARVAAVLSWIAKNIQYELNPSSADAISILEAGRGDCTEFAVLAVSLLRALSIPAEVRGGLLLEGTELVAHAWVAYHDGSAFHEIDPTANRMRVHAGYLEASVVDVMALLALDQVRVTKVTALD